MSRDPYYDGRGRGGDRWDTDRFESERERVRFGGDTRDRFEERDSRRGSGIGGGRIRERSVDEYERRGSGRFEDDRYEKRVYYDDEPRYERQPGRDRGHSTNITIEKEREYYSPSPPRRQPARPGFLRRQSSLDTFDRRPLARFSEREEYGPPARYRENVMPPPLTPIPLPRTRALPPPRRYAERDYEDIRVAEPDFYGDEEFRGFPERVREREIIRRRRRSRSRESRATHSVRSSSSSSRSSVSEVRNEFPKKGKTRMPARLVSIKAIIDLGYPYEQEGDVVIIQKALGRENIDEVIKLSEDYKSHEKAEIHGGRSDAGTVVEETHTHEVFTVPDNPPPPQFAQPPPPPGFFPPPPPPGHTLEVTRDIKTVEHRSPSPGHHHHHHNNPIIIDGGRPESVSDPMLVGPLALANVPRHGSRDERAIRAEIKSLEAEKEALKLERRAEREMRKADRIRRGHRSSETDLVLYEQDSYSRGEEVTLVRRERITEPEGGVRIEKDRKGPPPKLLKAMLKTLT